MNRNTQITLLRQIENPEIWLRAAELVLVGEHANNCPAQKQALEEAGVIPPGLKLFEGMNALHHTPEYRMFNEYFGATQEEAMDPKIMWEEHDVEARVFALVMFYWIVQDLVAEASTEVHVEGQYSVLGEADPEADFRSCFRRTRS